MEDLEEWKRGLLAYIDVFLSPCMDNSTINI